MSRTTLKPLKVNSDTKFNVEDCESLFIELSLSSCTNPSKNIPLLIGCVYRHPRPTTSLFADVFCEKLSKYVDRNIPFIILGDINIDVSKASNSDVKYYINMLSSIGCKNFINIHTRISGNSRSTLDHILSNIEPDNILSGVINEPITDHLPIFAIVRNILSSKMVKTPEKDSYFWRFYDDNKKDQFLQVLEDHFREIDLSQDPEKLLEALTSATRRSIDLCFPLKEKSNRAKKRSLTPWFDSQIFKEMYVQRKLWRRFVKTKNLDDLFLYKLLETNYQKRNTEQKENIFMNF